MGVPSKNSSVLDMGRRPELKSDEFFEGTPLSSRDNCTFVLETAQESGSVIGGATHHAAVFPPRYPDKIIRDSSVQYTVDTPRGMSVWPCFSMFQHPSFVSYKSIMGVGKCPEQMYSRP